MAGSMEIKNKPPLRRRTTTSPLTHYVVTHLPDEPGGLVWNVELFRQSPTSKWLQLTREGFRVTWREIEYTPCLYRRDFWSIKPIFLEGPRRKNAATAKIKAVEPASAYADAIIMAILLDMQGVKNPPPYDPQSYLRKKLRDPLEGLRK